jgi:hypothetical protein
VSYISFTENDEDDDTRLAVCQPTYRRIVEAISGSIGAAREAVRFESQRAGFDVANDDEDVSTGVQTVVVMLADGRLVQHAKGIGEL